MSEWAIREKKEADNTFELLAIKTYCYSNIFHVRASMHENLHSPHKIPSVLFGFLGNLHG
jgi:hypothetical protein